MSSRRNSLEDGVPEPPPPSDDPAAAAAALAPEDLPPSRSSEVSTISATSQMSDAAELKAASRSELLNLLTTMGACSRPDTWTILVDLRSMFEPVRLLNFLLARYSSIYGCTYEADNDTFVQDDPNRVSETQQLSTVADKLVILSAQSEDLTVKAAVLLFVDRWVEWFPLDFLPYSELGFKLLRRVLKLLRLVLEEDFPTIITREVFDKAFPQLKTMLDAVLTHNQAGGEPLPSINTAESRDLNVEAAHKAVVSYLHQLHGLRFNCAVDPSYADAVDCTPMERRLAYVLFSSIKKNMETVFEWYKDVVLSLVIAECSTAEASFMPPSVEQCRMNTLYDQLLFARSGHTVQRMYTFARMVPIQAPTANTKRTASTRQRMTLSRKLGLSRESSTYEDANGGAKAKSIADIDAWEVAQQVTLRLHYLYASVPCDQMLFDLHSSPELTRFRAESERLQSMFVNHILICTEAKERADRIVHLLDVVDALLELRSFHAVMLIVMALQSTPVHRLKQTWALVDAEHPGRWDDLHRSVGLGGQHLVSKANGILTNDPACKLEIECPRQAAVDASLQLLRPALSRQVTEELLARTTDIGDDEDSDEGEDGFDDGDTFSNLALRKVAREVLSRAESSRLDILKPLREAQPAEMNAEVKRAARMEKLKAIVAGANIVSSQSSQNSIHSSSSMDSLLDSLPETPAGGAQTPTLKRGSSTPASAGSNSGGIAMRRSPLFDKLRSASTHSPPPPFNEPPTGKSHTFFPTAGAPPLPARLPTGKSNTKLQRPDQPPRPPRRSHHTPKVPPPMIPAYSFPIPMMPYIYGYTRMLMQFKELPAYCAAEGEAPDGERSEQLNVSRLRKISSITAVLKSCQLTPFQFKAMPEVQHLFEKRPTWLDEDSQWTRSVELEGLSTPSANS